jgi:hypothetical protein
VVGGLTQAGAEKGVVLEGSEGHGRNGKWLGWGQRLTEPPERDFEKGLRRQAAPFLYLMLQP